MSESAEPKKLFDGDTEMQELQDGFMILSKVVLEDCTMYPGDSLRLRQIRKSIEARRNGHPREAR